MMTIEKCRAVLDRYEQVLTKEYFGSDIDHLRSMIPKMRVMLDELHTHEWNLAIASITDERTFKQTVTEMTAQREKFMRWLGFMQGAFWLMETYTIDDLKAHNKPDNEPFDQNK